MKYSKQVTYAWLFICICTIIFIVFRNIYFGVDEPFSEKKNMTIATTVLIISILGNIFSNHHIINKYFHYIGYTTYSLILITLLLLSM